MLWHDIVPLKWIGLRALVKTMAMASHGFVVLWLEPLTVEHTKNIWYPEKHIWPYHLETQYLYSLRVCIPGNLSDDCTLYLFPFVQPLINIHTLQDLEMPVSRTCKSLEWERKLENPKKTHQACPCTQTHQEESNLGPGSASANR